MIRTSSLIALGLILISGFIYFNVNDLDNGYAPISPELPLPSTLSLVEYEKKLYSFLENQEYVKLNWKRDKEMRNTGPFVDDKSYGTHPSVVIYYSPEIYDWLKNRNREGEIKDGAMIVKVMYAAPAQRYGEMSIDDLNKLAAQNPKSNLFEGWTVMVKDSNGSKDGWFWSYYIPGQPIDYLNKYPYGYPQSGFGNYCVRCHSSAESESTFASLNNIEGEEGDPIGYYVDQSWQDDSKQQEFLNQHEILAKGSSAEKVKANDHPLQNSAFLKTFPEMDSVFNSKLAFPPATYDHVISGPDGPGQFLTSDQCLSCHDGQAGYFQPNMVAEYNGEMANISPFGEWRWSMMGLAGRDPIFYAQLESEKTIHNQKNLPNEIQNLCFSCHGVMGQRQFHEDYNNPDSLFLEKHVYRFDYDKPEGKYGALARDGISCMSCHQIVDDKGPLKDIQTGKFKISAPGEIYGPFAEPLINAMNESLGIIPKNSEYLKSSRLCASCHTINLPVYNNKGDEVGTHYEQATYLEWLNSSFQDEYKPIGSDAISCQGCHMPNKFPIDEGPELAFKIANIQDQNYPESDHLVEKDSISLRTRSEYKRHTLLGINIYGLEMFNQFDSILGVGKKDFMTGLDNGLSNAIENSNRLAKGHSVKVELPQVSYKEGNLKATVRLTNLTGHRFPSGVGFRRAFIQLAVLNAGNDTIWVSGRVNNVGVIIDQNGTPLPSEFLERNAMGVQQYEPHYTTINQQNQVQIYQELTKNPEGDFTTSFVSIAEVTKDNRLLPKGWTLKGPAGFDPAFAEATSPHGRALKDKLYMSGQGQDEIVYEVAIPQSSVKGGKVVATVYYQSIPPFYLKQRFETAKGKNGARLYYLASRLKTDGTYIAGWKLATGQAEKEIN